MRLAIYTRLLCRHLAIDEGPKEKKGISPIINTLA
jgi:hypothetical protein